MEKEPGRPTRVIVDGRDLNGYDPELGVAWRFGEITGWHKGLGVRHPDLARENGHGSYAQRGYRTGRLITITGRIQGHGPRPVGLALEQLAALLGDGTFGEFRFDNARGDDKTTTVQLHDLDDGKWDNSPTCAYQLQLWSPNSFRYGSTSIGSTPFAQPAVGRGLRYPLFTPNGVMDFGGPPPESGTIELRNPGTATAYPWFEVAGPTPASGFEIIDSNGPGRLKFLSVVPEGATLRIESRDGSALINGTADRSGDLVVTEWPSVAAESSSIIAFQPLAEASAAVLTAGVTATSY